MANCTGADAQYGDMTACMDTCTSASWLEGDTGEREGNTLQCRLTHATELATSDPAQYCPQAGPLGGGVCGSYCENYCLYSATYCSEDPAYANLDRCVASCDKLLPEGTDPSADENTVQCRIRHTLEAAASGDKAAACEAAALHGNDTCGSWCEVYCDLMELNCSDQPSNYASRSSCLDACASFATNGDPALDSGDTVQCRIHHAGVPALSDPANACSYAAQSSSNYCIDEVDVGF